MGRKSKAQGNALGKVVPGAQAPPGRNTILRAYSAGYPGRCPGLLHFARLGLAAALRPVFLRAFAPFAPLRYS